MYLWGRQELGLEQFEPGCHLFMGMLGNLVASSTSKPGVRSPRHHFLLG